MVSLSAQVPVKGVTLEYEDVSVKFDDNLVDTVPGEVITIGVRGATKGTAVTTRYLGILDRRKNPRSSRWGRSAQESGCQENEGTRAYEVGGQSSGRLATSSNGNRTSVRVRTRTVALHLLTLSRPTTPYDLL